MSEDTLAHTIDVVSAYVGNHSIRPEDVPAFIAATHAAVLALESPAAPEQPESADEEYTPAVTSRKSLANPDVIISMIDGKPYKTLRRHLSTNGLTPEQYRERYKLKPDYPMVAPSYSETRRSLANAIGLGRKAKDVASAVVDGAKALVGAGGSDEPENPKPAAKSKRTTGRTEAPPKKPRAPRAKAAKQQQAEEAELPRDELQEQTIDRPAEGHRSEQAPE